MHRPRAVLAGIGTAVPGEPVPQAVLRGFVGQNLNGSDAALKAVLAVFTTSEVETRHFALPLEEYPFLDAYERRSARFVEIARRLNVEAAKAALAKAGVLAERVTHVVLVNSTGLSNPSLDAFLINDLMLPGSVRRYPLWGLGCAGGAAALALSGDLARSSPDAVVLVVAVELCSMALILGDLTKKAIIAMSLFGDGAAAAVVTGSGEGWGLSTHRTMTWPGLLDVMGADVTEAGMRVVLSRKVPDLVRDRMGGAFHDLYAAAGLPGDAVPSYAAIHPGGPRVVEAILEATGLPPPLFDPARRVHARCGNMSSPTCIFVLDEILSGSPPTDGFGVYGALGPGLTSELGVLTRAGSGVV